MKLEHCDVCEKQTMFKRNLGFGTVFAVIATSGLWLFAIPFYPIRCVNCGNEWQPESGQFSWR